MNPKFCVSIKVELLEISKHEVRDLLDTRSGPDGQLIELRVNSKTTGNILASPDDQDQVAKILELAQRRRCMKATESNSHLLFTIHFEVNSDSESSNRKGCLRIVDLAGSEHENPSLHVLENVIMNLQAKKKLPKLKSRLTYLLRDSLGEDSKTLAIVCCSPHVDHYLETLKSMRFAYSVCRGELQSHRKVFA